MHNQTIRHYWYIACGVTALLMVVATYVALDSEYNEATKEVMQNVFLWLAGFFFFSFFAVIILPLVFPHRKAIFACQLQAMCFACFMVFDLVVSSVQVNHGSPGDFLAALVRSVFWLAIILELFVIAIAQWWGKKRGYVPPTLSFWVIAPSLAGAIIGGWTAAVLFWAFMQQPVILSQAKTLANGRAYCIEASSESIESLLGVNAINMFTPASHGHATYYHGLLVVQGDGRYEYWNWSHKQKEFMRLPEGARKGLRMDESPRCTPLEEWEKQLPFLAF